MLKGANLIDKFCNTSLFFCKFLSASRIAHLSQIMLARVFSHYPPYISLINIHPCAVVHIANFPTGVINDFEPILFPSCIYQLIYIEDLLCTINLREYKGTLRLRDMP